LDVLSNSTVQAALGTVAMAVPGLQPIGGAMLAASQVSRAVKAVSGVYGKVTDVFTGGSNTANAANEYAGLVGLELAKAKGLILGDSGTKSRVYDPQEEWQADYEVENARIARKIAEAKKERAMIARATAQTIATTPAIVAGRGDAGTLSSWVPWAVGAGILIYFMTK
jgi:hypothetical protein